MNLASLADDNLATYGEYEATIYDGRRYTNREQFEASNRFANALAALGVSPGDRVVVMLPNCPEVGQCYGAVLRAGGVVVPVLFLLATEELVHILGDSEAKVVVTSPEFAEKALEAAAAVQPAPVVVVVGGDVAGSLSYESLSLAQQPDAPVVEREASDPALFMYTSGTTGRPKGVVLTHGNMLHQAEAIHEIAELDPTRLGLAVMPMAHAAGLVTWVAGMKNGGRGVLMRWFDPEGFCRNVQEYQISITALVPTMAAFLLNHPAMDAYDLSSLEQVIFGAAPASVELVRAFEEKTGAKVRGTYGLTEAAPVVTADRPSMSRKDGASGIALPGVEIAIHDEDDRPLTTGESGEICVRGPNVMAGYHHMPEETAKTLRGGWLHTGDIGYLDEDGYLFVVDRVKDMIIRGGFNIYPHDVEEVLAQHLAVAESAVIGVPDPVYGEQVEAFVVTRLGADATEEELLAFCRERLAKYKTPQRITFVPDLPKSQVGKTLKRVLREQASARS
ncbi:MAG: long-chain fatty acid--CoA ligase [Actinobacteria bacterium]|nr:MAG: long-chain fatty acid--CoA ligase [Actinomycetota bacterium]